MTYIFITFGAAFGLIAIPLGFFIGLQVSPMLANVLLFPFIVAGWWLEVPLVAMTGFLRIFLTFVSAVIWAVLFGLVGAGLQKLTTQPDKDRR